MFLYTENVKEKLYKENKITILERMSPAMIQDSSIYKNHYKKLYFYILALKNL